MSPLNKNFRETWDLNNHNNRLPRPDTRDLPQTPVINVGGVDVPLPEPGPLVAGGSLAVVTTVVTLGATIGVNQAKQLLEP